MRLAVIVNEMSELDVDGHILDTSEAMSLVDELLVSIPAGSMSSAQGLARFSEAVGQFQAAGATHLIIATFRSNPRQCSGSIARFLSVVDSVTLAQDHDFGRAIAPAAGRNLAAKKRGIENPLVEQIMFANHILLSKMDRLSMDNLRTVGEAIHPINPYAEVLGM